MKAVVTIGRTHWADARLGSRPLPTLPLLDRTVFEYSARELFRAGVRDVLFVGGDDLAPVQDRFADGAALGLRIQYRNPSETADFAACLSAYANGRDLLVLPGGSFLGYMDLEPAKELRRRQAGRLRGLHHTQLRPCREEILPGRLECRRRYLDHDDFRDTALPATYFVVPASGAPELAVELCRPLDGPVSLPSMSSWHDFTVLGLQIVGERQYFELNRVLLIQRYQRTCPHDHKGARVSLETVSPGVVRRGPVLVAPGAVIESGATLLGPSIIGPGATVGRGAVVVESILWPGATVAAQARVVHSIVADGSAVPMRRWPGLAAPVNVSSAAAASAGRDGGGAAFWAAKRIIDLAGASVLLVALSPFLAAAAMAIKLTSRGPVLYRHRRQGRGGVEFDCLKFRTMAAGADALQQSLRSANLEDGPQFKLAHDPRVTTVGRILRATNFDEIPQLWNVLRGEMSLVGPRPSPHEENQFCPAWREVRLSVRPGISGLWQVCRSDGRRRGFHEWILYDIEYVRSIGWRQDAWIAWRTIAVVANDAAHPLLRPLRSVWRRLRWSLRRPAPVHDSQSRGTRAESASCTAAGLAADTGDALHTPAPSSCPV